eukprot:226824-Karenia_brevis.AAC.1
MVAYTASEFKSEETCDAQPFVVTNAGAVHTFLANVGLQGFVNQFKNEFPDSQACKNYKRGQGPVPTEKNQMI